MLQRESAEYTDSQDDVELKQNPSTGDLNDAPMGRSQKRYWTEAEVS